MIIKYYLFLRPVELGLRITCTNVLYVRSKMSLKCLVTIFQGLVRLLRRLESTVEAPVKAAFKVD